MIGFVLLSQFLISLHAQADMLHCRDIDPLRRDEVSACLTSSGVVFKRQDGGWRDTAPRGKFWPEEYRIHLDQKEAKDYCESLGLALPSGYPSSANGKYGFPNRDSDFVIAEKHGLRELFPDMFSHWFWSNSDDPEHLEYGDLVYVFNGYNGTITFVRRTHRYGLSAVRCMGK